MLSTLSSVKSRLAIDPLTVEFDDLLTTATQAPSVDNNQPGDEFPA